MLDKKNPKILIGLRCEMYTPHPTSLLLTENFLHMKSRIFSLNVPPRSNPFLQYNNYS